MIFKGPFQPKPFYDSTKCIYGDRGDKRRKKMKESKEILQSVAECYFYCLFHFLFYVCITSFILIFHMCLELWFAGCGERVVCPIMARRHKY